MHLLWLVKIGLLIVVRVLELERLSLLLRSKLVHCWQLGFEVREVGR